MRFSVFVRLRPGGAEGLLADEPETALDRELGEVLALASAPLQLDDDE